MVSPLRNFNDKVGSAATAMQALAKTEQAAMPTLIGRVFMISLVEKSFGLQPQPNSDQRAEPGYQKCDF